MAVIETYVSRKPASRLINLILCISACIWQIGCLKPPSSSSYLSKGSLSPAMNSSGFSWVSRGQEETRGESNPPKYSHIVKKYADRYELDWLLILSVMKQESQFKPNAVSNVGAYGLMQIMPVTQAEITEKLGVPEAKTPYNNIRAGSFHLRTLYRIFKDAREEDRIRLTLAAYNAGLGRIFDARQIAAYLGSDPDSWNAVKKTLPLLSRRYYTLHQNIWEGKPPSGYFGNWRQTTKYVDKVLEHYNEFSLAYH